MTQANIHIYTGKNLRGSLIQATHAVQELVAAVLAKTEAERERNQRYGETSS